MDDKKAIQSTYGRFKWLAFGYATSFLISALVTIILARLMGPSNYGTYAIAILLPMVLIGLNSLGFESAATFYVASLKNKDPQKAMDYFKTGLVFILVYSLSLATTLSLLSPIIAEVVFGNIELAEYFRFSSFMLISSAINVVVNGGLISLDKQKTIALYASLASLTRNSLSLILYVLTMKVIFAVIGQALGAVSASLAYIAYAFKVAKVGRFDTNILREMMSYAVPYGIGVFVTVICAQAYNLVAAVTLDRFTYGNFSAAWLIMSGIMSIPASLSTSLFPSFSEIDIRRVNITPVFNSAIKFTATVLLYMWVIFGGLADFVIGIIYGSKYTIAGNIFALLSSVFLLSILGWGVINPLLLSLKKTKALAAINGVAVIVSLAFLVILIDIHPVDTVWVIPMAFFVLHVIATILGLLYLRKSFGVKIFGKLVIKFSIVVTILFYLSRKFGSTMVSILLKIVNIHVGNIITIFISMILLGAIYLFILIAWGVVKRDDYDLLKKTFLKWVIGRMSDKVAEPAFQINKKLENVDLAQAISTPIRKLKNGLKNGNQKAAQKNAVRNN